jgi:hypothetical protein
MRYLSDAASILGGTQCPYRLHCCSPQGNEGWIESLFDLQCQRLTKIMGHLPGGTIGYPAQPRLNCSVCLSVCLSVLLVLFAFKEYCYVKYCEIYGIASQT